MVLQSNFAKRLDSENASPHTAPAAKSLATRLRSSLQDAARRRRARSNGGPRTPRYAVEQAKRRSVTKSPTPTPSLKFNVPSSQSAPADIEMKDAEPTGKTIPVVLPKQLGRPEYSPIPRECIRAVDPELFDMDVEYLQERLEEFGPGMLRVLSSVKANPVKDALPKELTIVVNDMSSSLPTHMFAVYGPPSKAPQAKRRKVTLFPVHSLIFSAYCSKLPPFPPSRTTAAQPTKGPVTVPVRPLCLPSPQTYPQLSTFLYTKRTDLLLNSLLPIATPPTFEDHREAHLPFATRLAGTFTAQALLQHVMTTHGLWQNVCALGIFDDDLWDTLDLAWEILLTAIAISTGNAHAMVPPSSSSSLPSSSAETTQPKTQD